MSEEMLLPRLHDLSLWASTDEKAESNEIWSVGISIRDSLSPSIVLSYLFSAEEEEFSLFLRKLTGSNAGIEDIKKEKNLTLGNIDDQLIQQKLNSFKPPNDDHTFFQHSKVVYELFRIFDLRLNRYAGSLGQETTEWNDDFMLNAASLLLECAIEVYLHEEAENKSVITYPKTPHNFQSNIILFQYENQEHGARNESSSVFHFGMRVKQAVRAPSNNERTGGIPPPTLQDLALWNTERSTNTKSNLNKVWEIGVPMNKSLSWSLVLSCLLSASNKEFPALVRKLIGSDEEVEDIKKEIGMSQSDNAKGKIKLIKRKVKSFNPFKNRFHFFFQCKEVIEIFRIFNFRLEQAKDELKAKDEKKAKDERKENEDFELNAASQLLECTIEVCFLDKAGNQKLKSYPKTPHDFKSKICLFQYENRLRGSIQRKEFHFAMRVAHARSLRLRALVHFLRKAKIPHARILGVKKLMKNPKNQEGDFLTTILESTFCDILPKIYSSPYFTLKLSEASFQTDPMTVHSEKLSPLCYAVLFNTDLEYIRILYDYASKSHCLFNGSVRRADDDVLKTLKKIIELMKRDISLLPSCDFEQQSKNRASDILNQFILFSEYQLTIVSDLKALTEKQAELDEFSFRKQVIESISSHYTKFFLKKPMGKLSAVLSDYFDFSEYYKNADDFTYLSFFDNFYRMKLSMNLKREGLFLRIEWIMFLAMISNDSFSKFDSEMKYRSDYDKQKCEKDCVLQYIPVLHRSRVLTELGILRDMLKDVSSPEDLELNFGVLSTDPHALPQVTDQLMTVKLIIHIDAALRVSPRDDGIKAVLAIERALQVIGESIKPLWSDIGSVRYLFKSHLPDNVQNSLVDIRNNISHCKGLSVHERLEIEEDLEFFDSLKAQLKTIGRSFKVVYYTQFLRIKESLVFQFIRDYKNELDSEVRDAIHKQYELLKMEEGKMYESYHNRCMDLLRNSVFALIKQCVCKDYEDCDEYKNVLIGWLQSIKTLLEFIIRHKAENGLVKFANDIQKFIESTKDTKLNDFRKYLQFFLESNLKRLNKSKFNKKDNQASAIDIFFQSLNRGVFSNAERSSIIMAVLRAYDEAEDARNKLKDFITNDSCDIEEKSKYLEKVLIPSKKIDRLRETLEVATLNRNSIEAKEALTYLEKQCVSKESIEESVKNYVRSDIQSNQVIPYINHYFFTLLKRIVYQPSKIYSSVEITDDTLLKLDKYLTKRARLLVKRTKDLKRILIDEDEEIKQNWTWGKSKAIKHHTRFLMRQRYMRDPTVRAALDMAFFDCMNILNKEKWKELYEKSTDLFSGVNLRNLVAHNTNIESLADLLDKLDFPSAMIGKMLKLIEDSEAVESMLRLFTEFCDLTEESFKNWILNTSSQEYAAEIKSVTDCKRWENYLSLFPFSMT